MSDTQTVSVILPTLARPERTELVRRALDSVLSQKGVRAIPLIVINGPECDSPMADELRADRRLRVKTLKDAHLPAALRAGREMVDTRFFAELDDDDILLPNGLATRVQALTQEPDLDAVITNGFLRDGKDDELSIPDVSIVERDPLRALLQHNWLLPGCWLCDSDRVGIGLFEGMPRFRECTYLAIRLATEYRIKFLDIPTVVCHTDTPRSESKSPAYVIGSLTAHRRILELEMPSDVLAQLRSRTAGHCRAIGALHRKEGNSIVACGWYLKSMLQPGGFRYLVRWLFHTPRRP